MRTIHSEANIHELEAMIDYLETQLERYMSLYEELRLFVESTNKEEPF